MYFSSTSRRETNALRLFPPVFCGGRMKGQHVMMSNVACHAMLWTENSNEHPKTRDKQKHDIEIPQNRLFWSGSRLMIVQNGWISSICEIYWEYGTAGHLVFWKPWPAVELKKVLSVTTSEPSVNQTLDLRSIKHFRIAWLNCLNRRMIVLRLARVLRFCEIYGIWDWRHLVFLTPWPVTGHIYI